MEIARKREFFIGIDLGWKEKKTTGICILEREEKDISPCQNWCQKCQDIVGKEVLKEIKPYLKDTKVIAVDAPLTKGRGKGKMRLYEKFLSAKIFKKERVSPIPPALMPEFHLFAREIKKELEKKGLVLDLNLIEVFPTITKKLCNKNIFLRLFGKTLDKFSCETENQKSALLCATLAYLHFCFKTRYLGYRDGFLFLPEMSFWTKEWREKFYQVWMDRPRLKYHYLITNLFDKKITKEKPF